MIAVEKIMAYDNMTADKNMIADEVTIADWRWWLMSYDWWDTIADDVIMADEGIFAY